MKSHLAVLVVDDEQPVRRLVENILKRNGYVVLSAASGPEALTLFRQHRGEISFVLTDVCMPGMTGPELVRCLLKVRADLPVIFMSGSEPPPAGGYDLLRKPFTAAQLSSCVRRVAA